MSNPNRRSIAEVAGQHGLGTRTAVRPGCALTTEGTFGRDAFIVVEGTARVTRDGGVVAEVGPDQFIGEMALIDHGPRSASVVATTPMRVLTFDAPAFASLLADPFIARELRRQVVGRLRSALLSNPTQEPTRRNQP